MTWNINVYNIIYEINNHNNEDDYKVLELLLASVMPKITRQATRFLEKLLLVSVMPETTRQDTRFLENSRLEF